MTPVLSLDEQLAAEHASFGRHLGSGADSWADYWLICAIHEVQIARLLGIRASLTGSSTDAQWAAHYRAAARTSMAQAEDSTGVPA